MLKSISILGKTLNRWGQKKILESKVNQVVKMSFLKCV